jgi:H+/gluconate symporter-like permease
MTKKFILSALACAVIIAIPNAIITPLFYYDFLKNNSGLPPELWEKVQRTVEETEVVAAVLSILLIGCLTTLVIYWTKVKTFMEGFKKVFIFSVLMMGVVNFGLLGTTHYWSYKSAIIDILVASITFALGGGVAALIMGWEKKQNGQL